MSGHFFREAGSDSGLRPPQGQKSVLEQMGAFSMYVCIEVMLGHCGINFSYSLDFLMFYVL